MRKKWIFLAPLAIVGFFAFIALGGYVVKFLWNWLLPPIFGWRLITFWQALGLLVLCRILFGGWSHSHGSKDRHGMGGRIRERMTDRMADRMAERWQHMTPEERERFQQRMRERCGFPPAAGGESKTE